jgi:hypothetical protein
VRGPAFRTHRGGRRAILFGALLSWLGVSLSAAQVPTPASVFGFSLGEDRKLADWDQLLSYFGLLARASPRVRLEVLGPTTEGRPLVLLTITSEQNQASLAELLRLNDALADPRSATEERIQEALAKGRTIVSINCGIHSLEVATTQACTELAHGLAAGQDEKTLAILDKTVVVMVPSQNPDGTQKVADWYRNSIGTFYEGGRVPFLLHTYAGHDNNRDWYMFTQAETRLAVERVYHRFHPQIVNDLHQMGPKGARLFVPPYLEPYEPNVDPALHAEIDRLGLAISDALLQEGKTGVVNRAIFDAWTPSRAYALTHGGLRILTECASSALATPVNLAFPELEPGLGYDPRRASPNFPAPWPGGSWRLRDAIDYEVAAARALLVEAASHRESWLRTFLEVNRRAATREHPYAFVVPPQQPDAVAVFRLLSVLRFGEVEIDRAAAAFRADGRLFPQGSHVIRLAQPAGSFAKALLEAQHYPELGPESGEPLAEPYDAPAHTLPLLLGVEVARIEQPFEAALSPEPNPKILPGSIAKEGAFLAIAHTTTGLVAAGELLRNRQSVRWTDCAFEDGGRRFPAGTLVVPGAARPFLEMLAQRLGIQARGIARCPPGLAMKSPRLGVYQSWVPASDEGWTRFVLEKDLGVPFRTLHDADVRSGDLGDLDAIVIPDEPLEAIKNGNPRGSLPPEYVGGLEGPGVRSLRAWVEAGGTLVALNQASRFFVEEFSLPVRDVLATASSAEFSCPGSILSADLASSSLIGHGLGNRPAIWFEGGPAFEAPKELVVLRYGESNPLLSGLLRGETRLVRKAALVDVPLGLGRIVLFGFRPQYRGQSWATYVALQNALFVSAATRARAGESPDLTGLGAVRYTPLPSWEVVQR